MGQALYAQLAERETRGSRTFTDVWLGLGIFGRGLESRQGVL